MLQALVAGGKLDLLTREELHSTLTAWRAEQIKGVRTVQITAQGAVDPAGAVRLGGHVTVTSGTLGPRTGFVWSVKRLAVRLGVGFGSPSIAWSIYVNQASPAGLVRDVTAAANGYAAFQNGELLLNPEDRLAITAQGNPGDQLFIAGQAIEAPIGLFWRMLS